MSGSVESGISKLELLRDQLRSFGSALICYSGGIDSALVLAVATQELGNKAIAFTAVSPSLSPLEHDAARRTAARLGADHRLVTSHELNRPGYAQNGPDRCFHCKSELYEIARAKCREWGLAHILNGTNADDVGDYRPGLQAASNAGVKSPLLDLGFSKADVREAAKALGLEIWDKPAMACLSSRIPYGTLVTAERLKQIGSFEAELLALGFRQVRVRYHQELARIELGQNEIARALQPSLNEKICAAGRVHGFLTVTIDPKGYRQGSHNEALENRRVLPIV